MIKTFGKMPSTKPEGMFIAVRFPVLAMMDKTTGDHRRLASEGGGARETPSSTWSVSAQFTKNYGHDGAELSGALYAIELDDSTGIAAGVGYLADTPEGRRHAFAIKTGMMAGNSVGLAEVSAQYVENFDTGEWWVEFTQWNIADTSGVMTPAFYEAYAVIDDDIEAAFEAEITAAFAGWDMDQELVASCTTFDLRVPEPTNQVAELIASASGIVADYADFFRPEADEPTKIVVTADGKVYGHVCQWDSFHASMAGNIRPPRPADEYRSFNKPGVLTERGIVPTGPIFAYGGHRPANGATDLSDPYGGIENAWCDGRITEGRFGPWFSGVVRPGVSDEVVYAARASRISGHWLAGDLKAIVSVNAEAFEVKGPKADVLDLSQRFAYRADADGQVLEMVASFEEPKQAAPAPQVPMTYSVIGGGGGGGGGAQGLGIALGGGGGGSGNYSPTWTTGGGVQINVPPADPEALAAAIAKHLTFNALPAEPGSAELVVEVGVDVEAAAADDDVLLALLL